MVSDLLGKLFGAIEYELIMLKTMLFPITGPAWVVITRPSGLWNIPVIVELI